MKTSAKYFALGQVTWAKNYFTYDITHKKSATPNQKIFECRLEDWPIRLKVWTAL